MLNTLLNEEKAIVSDIAGTTRDFIEDVLFVDGVGFRFTDTAGIRDTEDILENLGIERSFQKMQEAKMVLYLLDIHRSMHELLEELHSVHKNDAQSFLVLLNKADKLPTGEADNIRKKLQEKTEFPVCSITARDRHTLTPVFEYLSDYIQKNNPSEGTVITSSRHFEALSHTSVALDNVLRGMDSQLPTDLVAMDIREALYHLGTITGQVSTDDLLESIFTRFCIGK